MDKPPLVPRPAATIMLVRPHARNLQVFMLRRSAQSAFVPDAYVFPGGGLEEHDCDESYAARVIGLENGRMEHLFRSEPLGNAREWAVTLSRSQRHGLLVACARELFEEAGVLLAVPPLPPPQLLAEARAALQRNEITFGELINRLRTVIDLSAVEAYSRWITPPGEPRRFDAYFFLAAMPPEQTAAADLVETTHAVWIEPQEALERADRGEMRIVYPTRLHLRRLTAHASLESLFAHARSKEIVAVSPDPLDAQLTAFRLPDDLLERW
ncbi:MAG TPA: hypothetical protein VNJ51_13880 [Candidatus Dormibacteraeota bacterium]|nr:hypothetical protein [Candidatus Dormibacteraeota bacterium]